MADSVPSEPAPAGAPDIRTTGAWVHVLLSDDQGVEIAAAWSPPPDSELPTHPHVTLVYLWDDATSRLHREDVEATIRDALTEQARVSTPTATALPGVFNGLARFATALHVFSSATETSGWVFDVPGGRFTLLLTPGAYRGFSGEGQALCGKRTGWTCADDQYIKVMHGGGIIVCSRVVCQN